MTTSPCEPCANICDLGIQASGCNSREPCQIMTEGWAISPSEHQCQISLPPHDWVIRDMVKDFYLTLPMNLDFTMFKTSGRSSSDAKGIPPGRLFRPQIRLLLIRRQGRSTPRRWTNRVFCPPTTFW